MNIPLLGPLVDKLPTWFLMVVMVVIVTVASIVSIRYVDAMEPEPVVQSSDELVMAFHKSLVQENKELRAEIESLKSIVYRLQLEVCVLKDNCGDIVNTTNLKETAE